MAFNVDLSGLQLLPFASEMGGKVFQFLLSNIFPQPHITLGYYTLLDILKERKRGWSTQLSLCRITAEAKASSIMTGLSDVYVGLQQAA